MAKDKKDRKPKRNERLEEVSAAAAEPRKKAKKAKKGKAAKGSGAEHHPLEAIGKLLDHPLVNELLAVGALAAVAAVAESGKVDPTKIKSKDAVKAAGKAAAAAIGAKLLKEVTSGGNAAKADAKKA